MRLYLGIITLSIWAFVASAAFAQNANQASTNTRPPMAIKVEEIPQITLNTRSGDGVGLKDFLTAIPGILSVFATIAVAVIGYRVNKKTIDLSIQNNDRAIWQKANEIELRSIQDRLDNFYGPFLMMLKADHELAQELRRRQIDPNFRLLVSLFDQTWRDNLTDGDKAIVKEICTYAKLLRSIVIEKSGLVDEQIWTCPERVESVSPFMRLRPRSGTGFCIPGRNAA